MHAEQGLKKEEKQSWGPAALLKGAFWHYGKYNYGADLGLEMTLESCQPLIRFWQNLLGFGLPREAPHEGPPTSNSISYQVKAMYTHYNSVELQQNGHSSPKVEPQGADILFPPEHLLPARGL